MGVMAVAWAGGLVWFAAAIPGAVTDLDTMTDAIVVPTGGSQRLNTGLELLAQGKARALFVSGVHPSLDVAQVLKLANLPADTLTCCVVLGYSADNTVGNAIETAAWMASKGYSSLRLVTSNYHMPRSLLEFRSAMPKVEVVPHPVFPETVKEDWWRWPGTASLIVSEYNKYLATLVRIGALAPLAPSEE